MLVYVNKSGWIVIIASLIKCVLDWLKIWLLFISYFNIIICVMGAELLVEHIILFYLLFFSCIILFTTVWNQPPFYSLSLLLVYSYIIIFSHQLLSSWATSYYMSSLTPQPKHDPSNTLAEDHSIHIVLPTTAFSRTWVQAYDGSFMRSWLSPRMRRGGLTKPLSRVVAFLSPTLWWNTSSRRRRFSWKWEAYPYRKMDMMC